MAVAKGHPDHVSKLHHAGNPEQVYGDRSIGRLFVNLAIYVQGKVGYGIASVHSRPWNSKQIEYT
jgi:hypothetical protein